MDLEKDIENAIRPCSSAKFFGSEPNTMHDVTLKEAVGKCINIFNTNHRTQAKLFGLHNKEMLNNLSNAYAKKIVKERIINLVVTIILIILALQF